MKIQRLTNRGEPIILGYRGENGATQIEYDIPDDWQEGTVQLRNVRNGETEPYLPSGFSVSNGIAYWTVSSVDTAITGEGIAQFCLIDNGVIAKSRTFRTVVQQSADNDETTVPEPETTLIEAALELATESASTAQNAAETAVNAAEAAQGAIYEWFTLSVDTSTGQLVVTENERSDD